MKTLKKFIEVVAIIFVGVVIFKAGQASGNNSAGTSKPQTVKASRVKNAKLKEGTIYDYKGVRVQVRKYSDEDNKGKKYTHEIVEVAPKEAESLELAKWDTKSGKNKRVVMDYSKQPKE
ncbi:hypothetical protein FP435_04575 [Lactobacillus sp. PV037]|uniref:hypothetical protein n=1 Tax=Lactobacillus sp. PV037 TaxID=2594496 RepID=UPI00223F820C|nr:hypothetical protein [Lactobacillus sp. PV037]QNQ83766.1 hypothetical protein FP435_04575 [Lactobacillus sp. PV037]